MGMAGPVSSPAIHVSDLLKVFAAMADKPRYYLTTAIAYPNGAPHVGFAYELIATDAIARFKRLDGYDVYFLTGTDEHGIKMLQTAAKEHITPQQLTARTVPRFRALAERMNCSNDDFIRTTEERHHRSSEAIWQRMEANGDIYLDKYSGWYSVRDEAYYDEDETRLDEKGVRIGPQDTPVEWVEEESYFFRLSAYQQKLIDLYEKQPDFVLPKERLNEVSSFVRRGLQDLSISRTTFDWGIPVPGTDPQGRPRTTNAKHVMYVWVDALTNYITGVGFPDTDSPKFRRYWPADLHVIGKDITRFHAVYWPAFLMSARIDLPRRIFSHGFLFNRGEKMSKSAGNVIDPFALADAYGVDQLRYFLLREVPFGQDGTYSHEAIVNRINADLANDLGNLAQRSLTMVARQLGGALPAPGAFSENDNVILAVADAMAGKAREAMKTQQLHQVLNAAWAVVADANRYFAGEAPWALAKTDPVRQGTVLYVTAEVIRQVAILAQPFMPVSAGKLLDLLAIPADERDFAMLGSGHRVAHGVALPAPAPVFPRYVESAGTTQE
jgi:methionyl-tRNA synthetase